jgi:adenylate kinase
VKLNTNLVIFGPPGSGKGTYASRLHRKLNVPAIATGDIFRNMVQKNAAKFTGTIGSQMGRGDLVADSIVVDVVRERLAQEDCEKGYILDGYPRTLEQAQAAETFTSFHAIINLVVPDWIIIERLSSRRICQKCGAVYNLRFLKPRVEDACDSCGGKLYQRDDDTPKVIAERLKVYRKQSQPLLSYYRGRVPFVEYECTDVDVPPDVAVEEILTGLGKLKLNIP